MRPCKRGNSPLPQGFTHYRDAFDHLLNAIGKGYSKGRPIAQYCSYCERVIATNLAVEHVQPKDGPHGRPDLKNEWDNFLLACVNCNSTKGNKAVNFNELFLPDRDNTFLAFEYDIDGTVSPRAGLTAKQKSLAQRTIDLVGLNAGIANNGTVVSKDKRNQRINAYLSAIDSLEDFQSDPNNEALKRATVKSMVTSGYFSIWMKVFDNYPDMKSKFIDAHNGTRASGCFNGVADAISPHPNTDNLECGSKI